MKTILTLVDFSAATAKVIAQTEALAKAFGARVILVHVLKREPVVFDVGLASPTVLRSPNEEAIQACQAKLDALRDSLTAAGIAATAQQFADATMAKIIEGSIRLEADVIVVGSHHHSALYDLFIGSFTQELLKLANCPVLVVPVDAAADR